MVGIRYNAKDKTEVGTALMELMKHEGGRR